MARFAILMYEDDGAWAALPPARQQELYALYGAYVEGLRSRGAFVAGHSLGGPAVRLVGGAGGEVRVDPDPATTNVLTGWFVVEAPDAVAAVELAKGCPALLHGERVVVRPTGHGG
ncbi:MAG: hypothetical protein IT460_15945 [Planctomycetes bacterium]|nr:hypothetical protein [Planctomycetota bacterium]